MLAGAIQLGSPVDFGACRSCRSEVGWVLCRHGRIPVNPKPSRHGNIAVLRDGHRAVDLADDRYEDLDRDEMRLAIMEMDIPLYVVHWITCPARGLRHAGWLAGHQQTDPIKERIRARKLAIDRARY
jgi:hypothetical protein